MAEKTKTIQEELELRGKNKQDVIEWARVQKGQLTDDIHSWIETQNQIEQKEKDKNAKIK